MKYKSFSYCLVLVGVFLESNWVIGQDKASPTHQETAKKFIEEKGETLFDHKHDAIQEEFPGGRSNKEYQLDVNRACEILKISSDWKTFNKYYLFEDDYFIVEWFYSAIDRKTGMKQMESTLGIGRIQDGKMILWKEYFDHKIGEYQAANLLPFFGDKEKPTPWPEKAILRKPYRP